MRPLMIRRAFEVRCFLPVFATQVREARHRSDVVVQASMSGERHVAGHHPARPGSVAAVAAPQRIGANVVRQEMVGIELTFSRSANFSSDPSGGQRPSFEPTVGMHRFILEFKKPEAS
jgi:hypothetical protein